VDFYGEKGECLKSRQAMIEERTGELDESKRTFSKH
jgi:hypothetical protein